MSDLISGYVFPSDADRAENEALDDACNMIEELLGLENPPAETRAFLAEKRYWKGRAEKAEAEVKRLTMEWARREIKETLACQPLKRTVTGQ